MSYVGTVRMDILEDHESKFHFVFLVLTLIQPGGAGKRHEGMKPIMLN